MQKKPHNIEDLLERMGTQEVPGEPEHRYELRRALLCSERFECNKTSRWDRWMSYTFPLVTGSAVVGVLVFFAATTPLDQLRSTPANVVPLEVATDINRGGDTGPAAHTVATEFLSDPAEPVVTLAEFDQGTTTKTVQSMKLVPLHKQAIVMVR